MTKAQCPPWPPRLPPNGTWVSSTGAGWERGGQKTRHKQGQDGLWWALLTSYGLKYKLATLSQKLCSFKYRSETSQGRRTALRETQAGSQAPGSQPMLLCAGTPQCPTPGPEVRGQVFTGTISREGQDFITSKMFLQFFLPNDLSK